MYKTLYIWHTFFSSYLIVHFNSFGQVDDILGEESDNESEEKEKGKDEKMETEEEDEKPHTSSQKDPSDHTRTQGGVAEEAAQTSTSADVCVSGSVPRYYTSMASKKKMTFTKSAHVFRYGMLLNL